MNHNSVPTSSWRALALILLVLALCTGVSHASEVCEPDTGLAVSNSCCEEYCGYVCEQENYLQSACMISEDEGDVSCSCEMPWRTSVTLGLMLWVINVIIACIICTCLILRQLTNNEPIDPTPGTVTYLFTLSLLLGLPGIFIGKCIFNKRLNQKRKRARTKSSAESTAAAESSSRNQNVLPPSESMIDIANLTARSCASLSGRSPTSPTYPSGTTSGMRSPGGIRSPGGLRSPGCPRSPVEMHSPMSPTMPAPCSPPNIIPALGSPCSPLARSCSTPLDSGDEDDDYGVARTRSDSNAPRRSAPLPPVPTAVVVESIDLSQI